MSRSEAGLHSNGDISNSHYDMNLVFIDALYRHLLWTGDKDYAREVWPVIERHLAWERRLFRREFGPKHLPLYEAYATIWASDDIQYSGGGVSYSSAYNLFHNRMAARIARMLALDPSSYEQEAGLISEAMQTYLWLPEKGVYAEYKDYLGNQLVHPSAGLWSFYHSVDSGAPSPRDAWRMAESVCQDFAQIPVRGPGVPSDADYHVYSTSNWMPYSWSVNNVVMGENLHTALGFWQAGFSEEAFVLTKSALLASMFMGISPGNVGTMNYLDVYRREAQRDFADGSGILSRALIEGLFGIRPDALEGELTVSPGLPKDWSESSLDHPDVGLSFSRSGAFDHWDVRQKGECFSRLKLRIPARCENVKAATVNGRPASWRCDPEAVATPVLEIKCAFGPAASVTVEWQVLFYQRICNHSMRVKSRSKTLCVLGAALFPGGRRSAKHPFPRAELKAKWTGDLRGRFPLLASILRHISTTVSQTSSSRANTVRRARLSFRSVCPRRGWVPGQDMSTPRRTLMTAVCEQYRQQVAGRF